LNERLATETKVHVRLTWGLGQMMSLRWPSRWDQLTAKQRNTVYI